MEPSLTPSNIAWDDAGQTPPVPASPPVAPPAPQTAEAPAVPTKGQIVWDQPPADAKPPGYHAIESLRHPSLRDPRTPQSVDLERSGRKMKGLAAGFLETAGAMTGDTPEQAAARTKRMGLETDEKGMQLIGGLLVPSPGRLAEAATTFGEARAADASGLTLGQRTGSDFIKGVERTLARLPGGGSLVRAVRTQVDKIAETTHDIVHSLSGGADVSPTGAGKVMESQIEKAAQRMKEAAAGNYDEVEKLIPQTTPVGMHNTLELARKLTDPVQGAEAVSQQLVNPEIKALREGLEKDLAATHLQALPYKVVKELRTRIGGLIDWGPFATDTKNGQLKQIYGSLTADMNNAASASGEKAAAAVRKANEAYAKAKEEQDVLKSVINKAGGPEHVFTSLMSGTKEGATTLKLVLNSIDEPSRQILAASALQRMGRATPGAQSAAGDVFSADTFLTNWNRMSVEARQALFGTLPGDYEKSISQLAANVESLKSYSKILANSSNTAHAMLWGGEVGGALMAVMTGHTEAAAGIAATAAGTKALSMALTNPQTAKWLAQRTSQMVMLEAKGQASGVSNGG